MSSTATSPPTPPGASSRRGVALPGRVEAAQAAENLRLRAALGASAREIAGLQRALAAARAENARLRGEPVPQPDAPDPRAFRIRRMLLDQHSRNP